MCWSCCVLATTITVPALSLSDFQGNYGSPVTGTATVTSLSTTITSSAAFPSRLVGLRGYIITLGSTDYYVIATDSTSSITLSTAYVGGSGSVSFTIYPVVLLRFFADMAYRPNGSVQAVQSGNINQAQGFFRQYACSVKSVAGVQTVFLPEIRLEAISDCEIALHRNARLSAWFFRADGTSASRLRAYDEFDSFTLLASPTTQTWSDIARYQSQNVSVRPVDYSTLTREQIYALLASRGTINGTYRRLGLIDSNGASITNSAVYQDSGGNVAAENQFATGGNITAGGVITPQRYTKSSLPSVSAGSLASVSDDVLGAWFRGNAGKWINIWGGEVDADEYGGLDAAITAIGSTQRTIRVSSDQALSTTTTIPKNITIHRTGTAKITIAAALTVTWLGQVVADKQQLFVYTNDSTSKIRLGDGALQSVWPMEWWGMTSGSIASGVIAQNWISGQHAFDIGSEVNGYQGTIVVTLGRGDWYFGNRLYYQGTNGGAFTFRGEFPTDYNPNGTSIYWQGNYGETMLYTFGANNIHIEGVTFMQQQRAAIGLHLDGNNYSTSGPYNIISTQRVGNAIKITTSTAHGWGSGTFIGNSGISCTSGTCTITTTAPHGIAIGTRRRLFISSFNTNADGIYECAATTTTEFKYLVAPTVTGSYTGGSVVIAPSDESTIRLAGRPEYGLNQTFLAIPVGGDELAFISGVTQTGSAVGTVSRPQMPSNAIWVERSQFAQPQGAGGTFILIGHFSVVTHQIADTYFRDLRMVGVGVGGLKDYAGVRSLNSGNVKNHDFINLNIQLVQNDLYMPFGSGRIYIQGGDYGTLDNGTIFTLGGQVHIVETEHECTCKLLNYVSQGSGAMLESVSYESGAPQTGDYTTNNVIITSAGPLTLLNNQFRNNNGTNKPPIIRMNTAILTNIPTPLHSANNYYEWADYTSDTGQFQGYIPVMDASGNNIVRNDQFGNAFSLLISSKGDTGGSGTVGVFTPLKNIEGAIDHIRGQADYSTKVATSGFLRLNTSHTLNWINEASNADLNGLRKVSGSNVFHAGDAAGLRIGSLTNYLFFDPTALSAARTVTWPDAATKIPVFGQTITFAGPSAARTVTLPDANFTAARSDAAQTLTGDQMVSAGNIIAGTAGKSLQVKTGSNACSGSVALVGGTATVSTTCTPATLGTNGIVILTSQIDGGTPGSLRVSASVASTSFTITSSSGTDTSTVGWLIIKQN